MRRSTELIGDFDNEFSFIGNEATKFYFLTDLDAPTKRIVAMDIDQAGPRAPDGNRAGAQGDARRRPASSAAASSASTWSTC